MLSRNFLKRKSYAIRSVLKLRADARKREKSVVVALSGGVDSSVSAYLLKKQGFDVSGIFMKNWNEADEGRCGATQELEQVDRICKHLNIQYSVVDFQKEYWNRVFLPFLESYEAGNTPNPDVHCNREIKFHLLLKHVFLSHPKLDYMATGHYVQIAPSLNYPDRLGMLCAEDMLKDQTYFLVQINPESLSKCIFPVGNLKKSQVKQIAIDCGLPTAYSKESMGICFVGKRKFANFIENYLVPREGNIISIETGEVLGRHRGANIYTIGQNAPISGAKTKMFVCQKNGDDIYVCSDSNHPSLYRSSLRIANFNWIEQDPPPQLLQTGVFECLARIRHQQPLQKCTLHLEDDGVALGVSFESPLRGINTGQFLAAYSKDFCLGGGEIVNVGPSCFENPLLASTI